MRKVRVNEAEEHQRLDASKTERGPESVLRFTANLGNWLIARLGS